MYIASRREQRSQSNAKVHSGSGQVNPFPERNNKRVTSRERIKGGFLRRMKDVPDDLMGA